MPPHDRAKLCLVAALVLFANCLDLASTYLASPDLANEWNILERWLGLGWTGIIAAKVLGAWMAVVGYAYYLHHHTACYPAPGMNRSDFCRHFAFGRPAGWLEMQCHLPARRHLWVSLGYFWAGMQLLVVWVAADNLLLLHGIVSPIRYYSELSYHLIQSAVVASMVMLRFYTANYRRYCVLSQTVPAFD